MQSDHSGSHFDVGPKVLEFYESLPFNFRESIELSVESLKKHDPVVSYPPLKGMVKKKKILEVGCGVGWMSNGLSYHHQADVVGIDFNPVAIDRARRVAKEAKLGNQFEVANLFTYSPPTKFDLVISLGVLHHTGDCHGAIRKICSEFVAADGHFLVGLYHSYGRRPFLDHFESMKDAGCTEDEMFGEFKRLRGGKDETHLQSWFRDQVIHPHETQHSFEEISELLDECQMQLVSTSINRFEPIESRELIVEEEKSLYEYSKNQIFDGKYFPGFFVVMVRRA